MEKLEHYVINFWYDWRYWKFIKLKKEVTIAAVGELTARFLCIKKYGATPGFLIKSIKKL